MNPSILGVRIDGGTPAVRLVKRRLAIDIRYSLHCLDALEGRELECLMLSAIVRSLQQRYFARR